MRKHRLEDRAFGFTLAGVSGLVVLAGWLFFDRRLSELAAFGLVLAGLAAVRPHLLMPLNRVFALLAARINMAMSLITLAVLFVLVIIPLGFIIRLRGLDPLDRKVRGSAQSYWIPSTRQIAPSSFRDLF